VTKTLTGFLLVFLIAPHSHSMSCTPNTDKSVSVARRISPYGLMRTTSLWVGLIGALSIPRTDAEKEKRDTSLPAINVVMFTTWLLNLHIVTMYGVCGDEVEVTESELTFENADKASLRNERSVFYFTWGVGVVWTAAVASQIENKDRWNYVSAVALAPLAADLISRIFTSHKISPYRSLSLSVQPDPRGVLLSGFRYEF
jgi:hypothetical protein